MSLFGATLAFVVTFADSLGRKRCSLGRTDGHIFAHVSDGNCHNAIANFIIEG